MEGAKGRRSSYGKTWIVKGESVWEIGAGERRTGVGHCIGNGKLGIGRKNALGRSFAMSNFFHEFDMLIMASVVMGGMFQNVWGTKWTVSNPNTSTFKARKLNGRARNDAMKCFIE